VTKTVRTIMQREERESRKGLLHVTSKGDEIRWCRHVAMKKYFAEIGGIYYLEIDPTYYYTRDGRRKHRRFQVDFPIEYAKSELVVKNGRAVNASEGGLLLHLPEEMEVGQRLALKLFFPSHSEPNTIETSVQVVWMGIHLRKDWAWIIGLELDL
jgi:hypothetical protein